MSREMINGVEVWRTPVIDTPDIDGGTIDGTVIGGTTPAAGTFTTLNANDTITLAAAKHLVLPLHADAATPTLAFGDEDTGFYEGTDDTLSVAIAGARGFLFNVNVFRASADAGAIVNNPVPTATVPTLLPRATDNNTGIGTAAADQLSLIAGGVEGQRITEASRTIETNATVAQDDSGTEIETVAVHGLKVDDVVQFAAGTGTLPTQITAATNYYVIGVDDANHFTISATRGGGILAYATTGTAFTSYELEIIINQYGAVNVDGAVGVVEITTPSALANYGKIYTKSDNIIYFQDGEGVEHILGGDTPTFKSYTVTTQGLGANPDVYAGGFYMAPAAEAVLNQGALTQTYGTANKVEGAHAFLVAKAIGTTDTGTVSIVVSGISITDAGARNASDSETIVADITALDTDTYAETTKKWLGQVTYTLTPAGGATTFAASFNYGFAKYEDFGNRDFKITDFEIVGFAGANDTNFDVILYHHSSAGWTYSAAAFSPGGTIICQLTADCSTDDQLFSAESFAYKRSGLTTSVSGSTTEGILADLVTTANNAIEFATVSVGVEL